jgi:5-methyltetrahydrofolate--homocysteine methyltransferase
MQIQILRILAALKLIELMIALATKKYGIRGVDLIFDALTLPISTGQEEYRTAGMHEAVDNGLDMAIVNYTKIYPLYKIESTRIGAGTRVATRSRIDVM